MSTELLAQIYPDRTSLEMIAPEKLRSLRVRQGYDYWRLLCGARRFPSRDEINPREIARVLTNMVLLKVVNGSEDFEFRIIGDHASRGYQVDLRNRRLSDVAAALPRAAANWRFIYGRVVESRTPLATEVAVGRDAPDVNFTSAEAVFLPLGATEDCVDHVLSFVEHVLRS